MSSDSKTVKGPGLLSPIVVPFGMAITVILYLLTTILLGTIIDFIGYLIGWWERDHQLTVLATEIQYLGNNFTASVFGVPPADLALSISQKVQSWLTLSTKIGGQEYAFWRLVKMIVSHIEPFWQNLVYTVMTVAVRCFMISMSIVFFILVFLVAAVDGLVERELRKEGGGLEHSKVYHHAKIWVGRVLIVSPIIYLSWPMAINPGFIILPAAFAFGFATYMTFSTFKKHL